MVNSRFLPVTERAAGVRATHQPLHARLGRNTLPSCERAVKCSSGLREAGQATLVSPDWV
jgi:hypothetical protein